MMKIRSIALPALLALAGAVQAQTVQTTAGPTPPAVEPRHVILIIGDGMDEHQVTIARNYLVGARGQLQLDQMPLRGGTKGTHVLAPRK